LQRDVPFATVLKLLEEEGYTLQSMLGPMRVFYPPPRPGRPARRIAFPVEGKLVKYEHVQTILKTIKEDGPSGD
jgi:hypothetical protein